MTSIQAFPERMRAGADAYLSLIALIRKINDATCHRFGEDRDGRDYPAIAVAIERSVREALSEGDGEYLQGYLRAMADRMSLTADGCGPGPDSPHPLVSTEAAYAWSKP
jgi:hypothetical protein